MRQSTVVIKKLINAPCPEVFNAWSQPELMKKWFYPNRMGWKAISTLDFKIGGEFRNEMINDMGSSFIHTGVYKEIIPNKKIVFTWNSHVVKDTLVTVEFKQVNGKTELTVTHDLIPTEEARRKHQEGWHTCLSNLMKYCSKPNFECHVSLQKSAEEVFKALTTELGLKGWWTEDCTVGQLGIGTEYTFRFGPTFTVMKVAEIIPNKKVVWECVKHNFVNPDLDQPDEWVGTKLIFHLDENHQANSTHLHLTQIGLTPLLDCFSICESKWNYYLKESLKSYVETGLGGPDRVSLATSCV